MASSSLLAKAAVGSKSTNFSAKANRVCAKGGFSWTRLGGKRHQETETLGLYNKNIFIYIILDIHKLFFSLKNPSVEEDEW